MGQQSPSTTTTTSSSVQHFDLPNTAFYTSSNWDGPASHSDSYSERAWTTQNPVQAPTYSLMDQTGLELQNLGGLGGFAQWGAGQVINGAISDLENKQVQNRVKYYDNLVKQANGRLQNLDQEVDLQNLWVGPAVRWGAGVVASGAVQEGIHKAVNRGKKLQNLEQDVDLQNLGWVGPVAKWGAKAVGEAGITEGIQKITRRKLQNLDEFVSDKVDLQNLGWVGPVVRWGAGAVGSAGIQEGVHKFATRGKKLQNLEQGLDLQNLWVGAAAKWGASAAG